MLIIDDLKVKMNAFYNLPYFYSEFRTEINFKPILEEIVSNENFSIEILRIIASSLHEFFEIADKQNAEDEFYFW